MLTGDRISEGETMAQAWVYLTSKEYVKYVSLSSQQMKQLQQIYKKALEKMKLRDVRNESA